MSFPADAGAPCFSALCRRDASSASVLPAAEIDPSGPPCSVDKAATPAARPLATRCWYAAERRSRPSAGFVMKPVSTSTTGTFAQLKPVRSLRRTSPRSRAPVDPTRRFLDRPGRSQARAVDVVGPAAAQGGVEGGGAATRRVGRAVGVDPQHQSRPAAVAVLRPRDVPAASVAEGRAGARHRHAVAALEEQRPRPVRDLEDDLGLARCPAAVLDLVHARARADRLALPTHRRRRPVARVQADQCGRDSFDEHAATPRRARPSAGPVEPRTRVRSRGRSRSGTRGPRRWASPRSGCGRPPASG